MTIKQKKMLREINSMLSVEQVNERHDYIYGACILLIMKGHKVYQLIYPSLSSQFDDEELFFYEKELVKRRNRLLRLKELDEEKYKKEGLI